MLTPKYGWAFNPIKEAQAIQWVNQQIANNLLKVKGEEELESAVKARYIALAGLVVDPADVVVVEASDGRPAKRKLRKNVKGK